MVENDQCYANKDNSLKADFMYDLLSIGEPYGHLRFQKWKSMSTRGIEAFATTHPNTFLRRTNRGIPQRYRWESWKVALNYNHYFSIVGDLYESYSTKHNEYSSIINIDVPRLSNYSLISFRTFPELKVFNKESQNQLHRILSAYGNYQPEIGYCQGMNFVAGLLLLVSGFNEKEAFVAFVGLMNEFKLLEFYKPSFPVIKLYTAGFENLLKRLSPQLYDHLKKEDVSVSVFLNQWFLTLFVASLPLRTVVALWDYMLYNGLSSVLTVSLGLMWLLMPQITRLNFEGILTLLKDIKSSDSKDDLRVGRVIINQAHRISTSTPNLNDYINPSNVFSDKEDDAEQAQEI
ncbi:uncharacterized protein TA03610 [Theileria annulata]|uniref:Rab-GAP TBC domain-containing protein n=1 Tax=Theileria annulata TaxID=5874 RepID=Q4UCH6_THEAN|nr:uncharacterized protein TA03610 [Theileria annulata]CAI75475.1 hypothetical protein, conserved [Theileria annulata]|eukprot:XP_954951.1 hypothetical protein, conserved [Theileria annulata]